MKCKSDQTTKDMKSIEMVLTNLDWKDMQIEILWSAFRAIQEDPELDISTALMRGVNEWDLV